MQRPTNINQMTTSPPTSIGVPMLNRNEPRLNALSAASEHSPLSRVARRERPVAFERGGGGQGMVQRIPRSYSSSSSLQQYPALDRSSSSQRLRSFQSQHHPALDRSSSSQRLRSFQSLERNRINRQNSFGSSLCSQNSFSSSSQLSNGSFQPQSPLISRVPSMIKRSNSRSSCSSGTMSSVASNRSTSSSINWSGSAVVQVAQRSNGAKVKAVIAEIQMHCEVAQHQQEQQQQQQESVHVPLEECGMLSLWSVDSYYKVLISKYGGIDAIVTAMRGFPNNTELQAYGCQTLKNMSNKLAVQQAGGVTALIDAMRLHPQSIHVQSEACEALQSQSLLLAQEPVDLLQPLLPLLDHAKDMYLTPKGRSSAEFMMDFVRGLIIATLSAHTSTTTTTTTAAASSTTTENGPLEHDAILQTSMARVSLNTDEKGQVTAPDNDSILQNKQTATTTSTMVPSSSTLLVQPPPALMTVPQSHEALYYF